MDTLAISKHRLKQLKQLEQYNEKIENCSNSNELNDIKEEIFIKASKANEQDAINSYFDLLNKTDKKIHIIEETTTSQLEKQQKHL